jgi:hypothetical protein
MTTALSWEMAFAPASVYQGNCQIPFFSGKEEAELFPYGYAEDFIVGCQPLCG